MSTAALPGRGPFRLQALPGALPLGGIFGGLSLLTCAAVGLLGLDRLGFTFCVFKLTTGLPCPTCGSTRALGRLAHLDLAGAMAMNPLAAAATLLLLLWGMGDALILSSGRALRLRVPEAWRPALRLAALLAVLLNWVFLVAASR